jgi:hypothetical protein
MRSSLLYHLLRALWFIAGPTISYVMCLGVAVGAAMTGPFGGFTHHERLSMITLMLFYAVAALLGVCALVGARHFWIRAWGRIMLFAIAPVTLGMHLNYTWASSGPIHRVDPSFVAGLISSWAFAIALWEFTCWLGRLQAAEVERAVR